MSRNVGPKIRDLLIGSIPSVSSKEKDFEQRSCKEIRRSGLRLEFD
jgi:hypothetical protein